MPAAKCFHRRHGYNSDTLLQGSRTVVCSRKHFYLSKEKVKEAKDESCKQIHHHTDLLLYKKYADYWINNTIRGSRLSMENGEKVWFWT